MRIIIDFDYTIFDTQCMRHKLIAAFESEGITIEEYYDAEREVTAQNSDQVYSFDTHIHLLAKGDSEKEQRLQNSRAIVAQELSQCVFPDAFQFLKTTAREHELFLLTSGEEATQRWKIHHANVEQYMQHIVTTTQPKEDIVGNIISQEKTLYIDDRGSKIDAVKERFPQIKTIWLHRPGTPYYDELSSSADYEYAALSEINF